MLPSYRGTLYKLVINPFSDICFVSTFPILHFAFHSNCFSCYAETSLDVTNLCLFIFVLVDFFWCQIHEITTKISEVLLVFSVMNFTAVGLSSPVVTPFLSLTVVQWAKQPLVTWISHFWMFLLSSPLANVSEKAAEVDQRLVPRWPRLDTLSEFQVPLASPWPSPSNCSYLGSDQHLPFK